MFLPFNIEVGRVMNPNYKNSAAVYSTYFTGQFVSNFAGKPIISDNLFNQFQLSGIPLLFCLFTL